MPDYGDDRGFGVRGMPADIGYDRMGSGYSEPFDRTVTITDLMGRGRAGIQAPTPTPIQMGGSRGEFSPPLYSGRNPFIQPIQTGGRYGEFPAMDSGQYLASRYGGGLGDAFAANDDARGMIEGAGFEVAGMTSDARTERKLWAQAVNKLPVGTPQPQIIEEWEKLKEEFYRRKYGE